MYMSKYPLGGVLSCGRSLLPRIPVPSNRGHPAADNKGRCQQCTLHPAVQRPAANGEPGPHQHPAAYCMDCGACPQMALVIVTVAVYRQSCRNCMLSQPERKWNGYPTDVSRICDFCLLASEMIRICMLLMRRWREQSGTTNLAAQTTTFGTCERLCCRQFAQQR